MKKILSMVSLLFTLNTASFAQHEKDKGMKKVMVPISVATALSKKYPGVAKVTWEKEKGNYEANWGGRSGEDSSVQFTPSGEFIEIVKAIPVSELPATVIVYIKEHYKGAKITEAGKVTDAHGTITYEAEANGKDVI